MSSTSKGWNQNLMMSLFTKETAYNAAVTVNSTNYCSLTGHADYNPDWADDVRNDKGEVSGYEHGTDQEIIYQGFKFNYSEPAAKPNSVIGLLAAGLGGITASQDGGLTAYAHVLTPVTAGTQLPSFNLIGKKGGVQYLYKGCQVNAFELSGEEMKPLSFSAEIIGSGYRATNADAFADEISESWMLLKNGYIWLESGATISIDAANTQGSENISSGTPTDLKARVKSFRYKWNNNIELQGGFGNGNAYANDADYGRRSSELDLTLRFGSSTDIDYFENQTALALEIEIKGAVIAGGGSMYYGLALIIPRFKLTKAPLPEGGVNDTLTHTYTADIQNDGTNNPVIITGYNAQAAYLG